MAAGEVHGVDALKSMRQRDLLSIVEEGLVGSPRKPGFRTGDTRLLKAGLIARSNRDAMIFGHYTIEWGMTRRYPEAC